VPSGLAHRRIAGLVLLVTLFLAVYTYESLVAWFGPDSTFEFVLLFILSFLGGTYLLSPDLDLSDSDPARNWGIVHVIWRPYSRIFRHRGLSHTPVIGTLTRIVYLGGVITIVFSVSRGLMGLDLQISAFDPRYLLSARPICVFAGLVSADLIHVAADRFFSK
jgi:uncharacterized metal-binding protein